MKIKLTTQVPQFLSLGGWDSVSLSEIVHLLVSATLLTDHADPQELFNRTALETQKLELMTEVSSLKLKLTALERDHRGNEVHPPPNVFSHSVH